MLFFCVPFLNSCRRRRQQSERSLKAPPLLLFLPHTQFVCYHHHLGGVFFSLQDPGAKKEEAMSHLTLPSSSCYPS